MKKTKAGPTLLPENYCYNLVYFEHLMDINYAIQREKEIKKWSRQKKMALIATLNPEWKFLNDEVDGDQ